ncbi:MAG: flagellar hook-associated protein 3 [Leptonema sp. (in: bacteria)]
MNRITGIMQNQNLIQYIQNQKINMDQFQNQLATGQRILRPADSPSNAANQMFLRTRLNEINQFEKNAMESLDRWNLIDGQLSKVTDILQRVRVLAIQASNGIYQGDNAFELKEAIASEIDQHLRALIDIGNSFDAIGRPLFGGFTVERKPFEPIVADIETPEGIKLENQIVGVEYRGDIGKRLIEIEKDQYIDVNLPGNKVFWGTNFTITGSVDTSGYLATSNQKFKIDGVEIQVQVGDTIDDIIDKINKAGIEVRASKVGQDNLSLHTLTPHQIWLEDIEGGTVLQDLGLINPEQSSPPNNYNPNAKIDGFSLFDVILKFRNDLLKGDQLEISGMDIGNLDLALENILRYRSEAGARQNRLEEQIKKISWDKLFTTEILSKNEGIDYSETIMNLKWMENVFNYSLNVGARIIRPTLLDFLR